MEYNYALNYSLTHPAYLMLPEPKRLCFGITNKNGNYKITDSSLCEDSIIKEQFVNNLYTLREHHT